MSGTLKINKTDGTVSSHIETKGDSVYKVRISEKPESIFNKAMLEEGMKALQQNKESTAIKQLARIGYENVVHDRKTRVIMKMLSENKRKNNRAGIIEYDV